MRHEKKLRAGCLYEYFGEADNTRLLPDLRVLKGFEHAKKGDLVLATGNSEWTHSVWWSQVFHLRLNRVLWMVTGIRALGPLPFKRLDSKRVSDKTKDESEGGT